MFGSEVLEVGIGLTLFFLLVSLLCSAVREAIEAWMKTRAMDLERGLRELLADPQGTGALRQLFDHPMINALFPGKYDPSAIANKEAADGGTKHNLPHKAYSNLPSYIPSAQFAAALLDIVVRGPIGTATATVVTTPLSIDGLRQAAARFPNERVKRAIIVAIDAAEGDLNKVKANLAAWFDASMERVSGWYKRRTQLILFLIGLGAAVAFNLDAITVAQRLGVDENLRKAAITHAETATNAAGGELAKFPSQSVEELQTAIGKIGYPVGWSPAPQLQRRCLSAEEQEAAKKAADAKPVDPTKLDPNAAETTAKTCMHIHVLVPTMVAGWLITALAVLIGAPFWFDLLTRFMQLRSALKPAAQPKPSPAPTPP